MTQHFFSLALLGLAGWFGCACSSSSEPGHAGGGKQSGTGGSGARECGFESVTPEMTCGSNNDGMVCPATTHCAACDADVTVSCTCRDSGTTFGHQFKCTD